MMSNISHSLEYWKYVCHCELVMTVYGIENFNFYLKRSQF